MGTLKQEATDYEPPLTLNIADLDKVPVDIMLQETEKNDAEGKPFKYKYAVLNGREYRVPNSVLEELQTILKLKPTVQFIRVKKSGSGLGTRYKVEEAI
jgi:hypothetical protein